MEREKCLAKSLKQWAAVVLVLVFTTIVGSAAFAAVPVIDADVTTPSSGCTFLGIQGKYITDAQNALDRINEIRWEACQEGVKNPKTGAALTTANYVPIKWSSDLEYIARIRAAESAITVGHARTNKDSNIWTAESPNGVQSYGEVLAWNWSESMITGINQWYEEKYDWVNNTGGVTGHYTSMINPDNLYVGLATFCSNDGVYYNTTAGEFTSKSGLDETPMTFSGECIQKLEVDKEKISAITVSGILNGQKGTSSPLAVTASIGSPRRVSGLHVFGTVTWESSAPNIASVDASGNVTANYCGTAKITASTQEGYSSSVDYTVDHTEVTIPAVAATCTATGLTEGKKCSTCGEVLTAQVKTNALGHSFGEWVTLTQATVNKTGSMKRVCKVCAEEETVTVPMLTPSIRIGKTSVKIAKTKSVTLTASFAAGDKITAKSSNKSIATVSVSGNKVKITAKKKAGTTNVTVTTGTGKTAAVKVTVPKVKTTKVTCKAVSVKKGKKVTLKPTVKPAYSDDKITFKSANKKIATVTSKGVVKGIKKGKTTITVKSGKKSVKVKVTVK